MNQHQPRVWVLTSRARKAALGLYWIRLMHEPLAHLSAINSTTFCRPCATQLAARLADTKTCPRWGLAEISAHIVLGFQHGKMQWGLVRAAGWRQRTTLPGSAGLSAASREKPCLS